MPTVEAPRFKRGYRAGLAASLALTAWTPVVWWFTRRQERQEHKRTASIINGVVGSSDIDEADVGLAEMSADADKGHRVGVMEREQRADSTAIVM